MTSPQVIRSRVQVGGALELIAKGDTCKRKAATAMNERSSRAHALFILSLTQTEVSTGVERTTRLFLADLGGSEKLTKSQVKPRAHMPSRALSMRMPLSPYIHAQGAYSCLLDSPRVLIRNVVAVCRECRRRPTTSSLTS